MNKFEKLKKYVGILIFTIIIGLSGQINAANSWRFQPDGKWYYSTT